MFAWREPCSGTELQVNTLSSQGGTRPSLMGVIWAQACYGSEPKMHVLYEAGM